jgi:hypothetical protein
MAKDIYQFLIKNPAGNYYYVDNTGAVSTDSAEQVLLGSVPDWQNLDLAWVRNTRYHGVFRKQGPDKIRMCGDGAQILRYIYSFEGGRGARATLVIKELDSSTLTYVLFGEFDFNFQVFESVYNFVDIALLESGTSAKMIAYDSTVFSVPLGDPAVDSQFKSILLDGVLLKGRVIFDFYDYFDLSLTFGARYTPPIFYTREEGSLGLTTPDNPRYTPAEMWPGTFVEDVFRVRTENDITATVYASFDYKIELLSPGCTGIEVRAEVRGGRLAGFPLLTSLLLGTIDVSPGAGTFGNFTAESTAYLFAPENYVIFHFTPLTNSATLRFGEGGLPSGYFEFRYQFRALPTVTRAITYFDLFKKLVGRLTGSFVTPPAISNVLEFGLDQTEGANFDLNPANLMVTCGDAIRGLPSAEDIALGATNPTIRTSFNDFYKDVFATLGAGIGIENISGTDHIVCEQLPHFYQRGVLIYDLGDSITPNWRRYPYSEYVANNLTAGYADQTYNDVNGRLEYNSLVNWQTTDERAEKDADYTAAYRADCYGVEYERINYGGKTSTDSSSDNNTFKILTTGATAPFGSFVPDPFVLQRGQVVTAGLPSDVVPTLWNMPLSPKRQIGRLLPFLRSNYYGLTSPLLQFQNGTKNTNLVSTVFSFSTPEDDNLDISGTTSNILWIPEVFEVEGSADPSIVAAMAANPYGEIAFIIRKGDIVFNGRGFVLEAGINTADRRKRKFKLLLSPDTPAPYNL